MSVKELIQMYKRDPLDRDIKNLILESGNREAIMCILQENPNDEDAKNALRELED